MSLFDRLFGKPRGEPDAGSTLPSQSQLASVYAPTATVTAASLATTRRELLRVVLRDTLQRHGIPPGWISAETLLATSRQRLSGIHWRLCVHHWDPRILTHGVALQHSLIRRLMGFDPMAAEWLMGISWQFALHDESQCPPMPHPRLWTSEPRAAAPTAIPEPENGGSADVIAGPVRISSPAQPENPLDTAREDLEKLFAIRDADLKHHAGEGVAPARPTYTPTEPARL